MGALRSRHITSLISGGGATRGGVGRGCALLSFLVVPLGPSRLPFQALARLDPSSDPRAHWLLPRPLA